MVHGQFQIESPKHKGTADSFEVGFLLLNLERDSIILTLHSVSSSPVVNSGLLCQRLGHEGLRVFGQKAVHKWLDRMPLSEGEQSS